MTNVPTPEEMARRRREAIENPSAEELEQRAKLRLEREEAKAKAEADLASLDVSAELDSLALKANEKAEPAGSGSAVRSSDRDEGKHQYSTTITNKVNCQEVSVPNGKTIKWETEITARRPAYSINEKLGNAYIERLKRELTLNECNLVGLLNSLMTRYGYAFASYEQLAHWLKMTPEGIRTMIRRLRKANLVTDVSKVYGKHRWVVCAELQNPKKKRSDEPPF